MSSNLFNRMLIISGWPAVLLTDAKSTVKNAGPVSTYYTTSADFISNERFFPRFYRTKSSPKMKKLKIFEQILEGMTRRPSRNENFATVRADMIKRRMRL